MGYIYIYVYIYALIYIYIYINQYVVLVAHFIGLLVCLLVIDIRYLPPRSCLHGRAPMNPGHEAMVRNEGQIPFEAPNKGDINHHVSHKTIEELKFLENYSTLPETNSSPLKMDGWNTFLLGRPIFRATLVSGRVFKVIISKPPHKPINP